MEPFLVGKGVDGTLFAGADVSDSGGDGGVWSVSVVSAFEGGGVDVVGEDNVVAEVEVSETGERGRKVSVDSK